MKTAARSRRTGALAAYTAIFVSWLPLAVLLVRSGGHPDAHLITLVGANSAVVGLFSVFHTLLCGVGVAAVFCRRFDILTILPIGPGLAILFYVLEQGFSDPAWFTIVAMCSIGEMVAILVALVYWAANRMVTPSDAGTSRETGGDAN
jgi:hypothetical protein